MWRLISRSACSDEFRGWPGDDIPPGGLKCPPPSPTHRKKDLRFYVYNGKNSIMSPGSAKIPGEKCLDLTVIECITVQSLWRLWLQLRKQYFSVNWLRGFWTRTWFWLRGFSLFLLGILPLLTDIPWNTIYTLLIGDAMFLNTYIL